MLLDEVIGITARQVKTRFGAAQSYDYLVLATRSQYTYFGDSEWPRSAPGLKSIDDASLIRRRFAARLRRGGNRCRPDDSPGRPAAQRSIACIGQKTSSRKYPLPDR